ncbi:MAG: glycoside hydrolase family 2 TIM barrel-domain containing protein, partial [Verrucomicrobiota bacterium]
TFGMREIRAEGDGLYVNGKPFHVRGFIRGREAHDHPNLEGLPLVEWYEKNILAAKRYGFNMIRFHSRIPPKECFEAADRLGMFLHVEIRKYFGKYQKERKQQDISDNTSLVDEKGWRDAILNHRNHPSLMVYCLGNEIRSPGLNPEVRHLAAVTKELDPTRLFIDTCAHGEFDRDYVDIDVQHMSYYYPFGRNYDMFDNTYNWLIYGSCTGLPLGGENLKGNVGITRAVPKKVRPVLAHEVCHYVAYHDLDKLEAKFDKFGVEKPWWIDELKKLVELKGLQADYPKMIEASRFFQFQSWKLGIEAARRSPLLSGFHFLQFSDTDRYENCNGVVDCFDDSKGVDEAEFLKFNNGSALLVDLPERTFFENDKVSVPVLLSHYEPELGGEASFRFEVVREDDGEVLLSGSMARIDLEKRGLWEICKLELAMPTVEKAYSLKLRTMLEVDGKPLVENDWNLWLFPNRPAELPAFTCTLALDEVDVQERYPQITAAGSLAVPEKLLLANRFTDEAFDHLEAGGDVLMLYRVPETRDCKVRAAREKYSLPTSWDRLKGVIWDRGTNCGAFMRESGALDGFPHNGFMDLQFAGLIDDCDKINLDGFPADVQPVMQGVDKAVRDRFDVFTFGLSELQPEWTMRKFAYALELRVGKGRLFLTGFNFAGLQTGCPEASGMFESIVRHVLSGNFQPETVIEADTLKSFLLEKAAKPLIKERRMTQYWQLDEEPLESKQYWKDSEAYIREDM